MNIAKVKSGWIIVIGIFCILFFCLPYFILGNNSYLTIHDFLDLTIGHMKSIIKNNIFFDNDSTLPLMEGIKRGSLPFTSPFELKNILLFCMPTYWAIILCMLFVKICAFVGMYFLLHNYVVKGNKIIALVISLIFSLIPFYVDYGLSSAGIPMVGYSLLNLYNNRQKGISYALIVLFALNSSIALSGIFVCFILFIFIIYITIKYKRIDCRLIASLCILSVIYIITNWTMLSDFFMPTDYLSNRIEMNHKYTFIEAAKLFASYLWVGQYHAGYFIALPIILCTFVIFLVYYKQEEDLKIYVLLFLFLESLVGIGVLLKLMPFSFLSSFQFDRFYFLFPILCFVLLSKSCLILCKNNLKWISIVIIIISFACVTSRNTEYKENLTRLTGEMRTEVPSYKQFYDEALFDKITSDLNLEQNYTVKVVSVGMFPSIAEYNGFYCLDGYATIYPLEYKHRFRKVISSELEKNKELMDYYDNWGNRCYTFSSELGKNYLFGASTGTHINYLDIDAEILKSMGCEYILSAVEIDNYEELSLQYIDSYTTDNSFWNIRVYKL